MKTKQKITFGLSVLALMYLVTSTMVVSGKASDTVAGFEENEFIAGLDLWINQTASAPQPLALSSAGQNVGWEMVHYFLLPDSVNLNNWVILDHSARFIIGGFGGMNHDLAKANQINAGIGASEEKSETGLTDFEGRDTTDYANVDANEKLAQADTINAPITYFEYSGLNALSTDGFDSVNYEANYTVPENNVQVGVRYIATDRKTIYEYAEEVSDADGQTLYNIANASIVNYIMKGAEDDIQGVTWSFQQESSTASASQLGLNAFGSVIKQATTFISAKKDDVGRTYSGAKKTVTDLNLFKDISKVPSTIAGLPAKAGQFVTETIPAGLHSVGNVVIGAFTGGLKNMGMVLLIGGLLLLGVIMLLNYRKGKGFRLR